MKRYLYPLIGLFALGFSTNATAQDDVTIILGNLEPTVEALAAGLEEVLLETPDTVTFFAATGDTVVNTGSALVAGTEQFGSLGLGLGLLNLAVQQNVNALAVAIDDPTAENINNVFNPDDLGTIAANLETVPDALIDGTPFAFNTGLRDAAVELLKGNLVDPALIPGPSATSSTLLGLTAGTNALFDGTNYGEGGANFAATLGFTTLVVNGATAGQVEPAEEALAPVFESAEPLTMPVIEAIEGAEL